MGFRDGKDLHATLNQGRPVTSAKQVYLKNLMTELSANINIHYGHALHHEGINIQGGAISPRYSYQNIIKRTRGSMIVGADGVFSTGLLLVV